MPETVRVLVGECTTEFDGPAEQKRRGRVVVLIKPDDTILVHDMDGYQPVAWLTRPAATSITDGTIVARDGSQCLRVTVHDSVLDDRVPVSAAGRPVGRCADCGSTLVRSTGAVRCVGCERRHGLPGGATITDETCSDCDNPLMRVERGAVFDLCIDRECDPLEDRVRERFDRAWPCPQCGSDLRVRRRGGLIAGCDRYPDCETGFAIPRGVVSGECDCGLPRVETDGGGRCLDATCTAG